MLGNLLAGGVRHLFDGQFAPTFAVGLILAVASLLLFFVRFREYEPS